MMAPFVSCLPIEVPNAFYTALEVVRAFTHCVTPANPSKPRYSSLSSTFNLNGLGQIVGASLALSTSGLQTGPGLLHVPREPGYRAFDVFYYLNVSSASQSERDFLKLQPYSTYSLLNKSGTFLPPDYMPTADDHAAAEDLRVNLRAIGIQGGALRNLISALTGLLVLGETLDYMVDMDVLDKACEDAAVLLDIDQRVLRNKCDTMEREILIAGLYEAIVDWVIAQANEAMRTELRETRAFNAGDENLTPDDDEDSVNIVVIDIPAQDLGRAVALRNVFDDTEGINAEMKEDGVPVATAGSTILEQMQAATALCGPELGSLEGPAGRDEEQRRDRREGVLEKVAHESDEGSYLKDILHPVDDNGLVRGVVLGTVGRFDLANVISTSRVWFHLNLHPTDESPASLALLNNHWSAAAISSQLRAWRLPEWANRRNKALDFTADFDVPEFVDRYARLGCRDGKEGVQTWLIERGWSNGEVIVGHDRVWMREAAWWEAESMLEVQPQLRNGAGSTIGGNAMESGYSVQSPGVANSFFGPQVGDTPQGSRDNLLERHQSTHTLGEKSRISLAPTAMLGQRHVGDYGLGSKGDDYKGEVYYDGELDPALADGKHLVERRTSMKRRVWVAFVWILTFWIPSPLLKWVGRMKRPDVRMAWREKIALIFLIFLLNGIVVFYIIEFGRLLCPSFDKAWDQKEVSFHQGNNDYWVSHHGKVYDLSKFWKLQHSDTAIETTSDQMLPFAGTSVDSLIRPPLTLACPHLVNDAVLGNALSGRVLFTENVTVENTAAVHDSGPYFQTNPDTKLHKIDWYTSVFLPKMKEFFKGDLVWDANDIKSQGQNQGRTWFTIGKRVYDVTDYFYNKDKVNKGNKAYSFFPSVVESAMKNNPGGDLASAFDGFNETTAGGSLQCLDNYFFIGKVDFRKSAKCQINNYLLLAFTIILCAVILVKFLAALQLGSKRRPAAQEKFVICQVPAYTEGEDQLRKGLDSLTALAYDNKRKLICVICDGMIVGGGNDRPTPKIVLDILGVDPKIDPPALPFKSVGEGSEQLNYGKVYSGLYEYEGNVVPYVVVVKVGKQSEQAKAKPGNRGKRDSQILLMSFLNRVHHRSPMSPLELEMFHQINNIIGVDPELYEYLFMVDADTSVKEDSLNRLVAACANDAKIAGICGETSLENEERSWWTMIQVYEYYISHHLAKAFESLFGSVTCLPGW